MKDTPSPLPLAPYLTLARDLSAVIVPVQPRSEFRSELYRSLLECAAQRQAELFPPADQRQTPGIPARFARWVVAAPGQDRRWVWGAAAVGSAVSLAGLVTYVWRRRVSRAA